MKTLTKLVRTHALGKARSVTRAAGDGPVVGVDTAVVLEDDQVLGKPADAAAAHAMLTRLAGRQHRVLSGLAVLAGGRAVVDHATTVVRFRALTEDELAAYVRHGEWQGRAGGYANQGSGAALVAAIEGDYLNVVGLPAALLVRLLTERFPGAYGFG